MFRKIRSFAPEHVDLLEIAYENSSQLGISAEKIPFRKLNEEDMSKVHDAIDYVFSVVGEGYGKCFVIHPTLKKVLERMGYKSEVVIGEIKVNGDPFIECDFEYIKEQWEAGYQEGALHVHCWLLLENGAYLDVTAYKDIFRTYGGYDLIGTNKILHQGILFEYTPIVLGFDFIQRTSIHPDFPKE